MTPQPQHPDDLFMITRDELDRCCSQMSAAGYKVSANYVEASVLSRPAPAPDCITCPKPAIGYGIGKDEARLTQCNTCMFDGKRGCMYHGYPDETIPTSCEYKIGKHAVIAPIEAQLHNQEQRAEAAAQAREDVLKEAIQHLESKREGVLRVAADGYLMGILDGTISYLESLRTGGEP